MKLHKIETCALALLVSAISAGLGRAQERPAWLFGSWQHTEEQETHTLTFEESGVFTSIFTIDTFTMSDLGRWRYASDTLHLATQYDVTSYCLKPLPDSLGFVLSEGDLDTALIYLKAAVVSDSLGLAGQPIATDSSAALTLPAKAPVAGFSLAGRWTYEDQFRGASLILYPEGRYEWQVKIAAVPVPETGCYWIEGQRLILESRKGEHVEYTFSVTGDKMTLSLNGLEAPMSFVREVDWSLPAPAESPPAQKPSPDRQTGKKTIACAPTMPLLVQSPSQSKEIPADPNPENIFVMPSVFTTMQLYIWEAGNITSSGHHPAPDSSLSRSWLYFLPTGRVYSRSLERQPGTPETGRIQETWGRYHVESEEHVWFETDAGKRYNLRFEDNCRRFLLGKKCYYRVEEEEGKQAKDS